MHLLNRNREVIGFGKRNWICQKQVLDVGCVLYALCLNQDLKKKYSCLWRRVSLCIQQPRIRAPAANSQDAGWEDEVEGSERKGQIRDF